jgi:hypothetical protein
MVFTSFIGNIPPLYEGGFVYGDYFNFSGIPDMVT